MKITDPVFIQLVENMGDFEPEEDPEYFKKATVVFKEVAEKEKEVQDRLFLALKDGREDEYFESLLILTF